MDFQLSYFKSSKIMLWKCCSQWASKFGILSSGHGTGKVSFLSNPKERQRQNRSKYHTIVLISYASKVMLKILQARLQQYMNCEFPDVQSWFYKGRGTEIKLPTSTGSWNKQESSRKTSISASLTMPKPLTVWITINCGQFEKVGNTSPPDLPLEKSVCKSGSHS